MASIDFSDKMDYVNGYYQVTLYAIDRSAQKSENTWELGSLDVWFKEGVKDANN